MSFMSFVNFEQLKEDYEEFHNCLTDLKEKEKQVSHIWIVQ